MSPSGNAALWTTSTGRFTVGPAPVPQPGPGELVVRAEAVAVNPVDAVSGLFRHLVFPKLRFPAVLGSDVAGTVVAWYPCSAKSSNAARSSRPRASGDQRMCPQ